MGLSSRVAIAVLTAYLAVSGSGALMALARKERKPARPVSQAAGQSQEAPRDSRRKLLGRRCHLCRVPALGTQRRGRRRH